MKTGDKKSGNVIDMHGSVAKAAVDPNARRDAEMGQKIVCILANMFQSLRLSQRQAQG